MSAGILGPCARRVVRCTIVTPEGSRFVGENWCATPQPACPRQGDEGYEKCQTICNQIGHAEEVAVMLAGDAAKGSHAYVENHTHACRNCQEVLFGQAGIKALTIGAPPEKV